VRGDYEAARKLNFPPRRVCERKRGVVDRVISHRVIVTQLLRFHRHLERLLFVRVARVLH